MFSIDLPLSLINTRALESALWYVLLLTVLRFIIIPYLRLIWVSMYLAPVPQILRLIPGRENQSEMTAYMKSWQ